MHLPPQDSVPVASLADGSATFFDGGPLGEVDVLLGGVPGFRDGGAVYAKFRGALYLASDYRDQDSVYVSDANNSCIRRVRFRRRQDCGRGPSHAAMAATSAVQPDAGSTDTPSGTATATSEPKATALSGTAITPSTRQSGRTSRSRWTSPDMLGR